MINYFLALAVVTAVGVLIGMLMIRSEKRRMARFYQNLREEIERRANTRPPAVSDSPVVAE